MTITSSDPRTGDIVAAAEPTPLADVRRITAAARVSWAIW